MCQPELCTQHLDTVKERQSGKRESFTPFSSLLFRRRSSAVNTVHVTRPSVSITLSLLSCRADIVGSSENFCQDNQTWQYPHPICKSKCAAVCFSPGLVWCFDLMHLSRLAGEEDGVVVGRTGIPARFYCEGMTCIHCVHVLVCVLKKSESKKGADRNTQTSAGILWSFFQDLLLRFVVLFCHLVATCGMAWPAPQTALQRVTLASVETK